MKSLSTTPSRHVGAAKQRGLVLFFALIALVAMSLAAITLVRSVDTTTLISGNLAFRQAATTSADGGTETAVNTMAALELANLAKNVFTDTTHAFNVTNAAIGYYSNVGTAPDLMAATTWVNGISSAAVTEATGNGNTYRYIIERMCRTPNVVLTIQNCLFSSAAANKSNMAVPLPSSICEGPGCPKAGQTPLYRVTVRVTGPKNTISYIQAMVY